MDKYLLFLCWSGIRGHQAQHFNIKFKQFTLFYIEYIYLKSTNKYNQTQNKKTRKPPTARNNFGCLIYTNNILIGFPCSCFKGSSHQKLHLGRVGGRLQVFVQPLLDDGQIVCTPFGLFLNVAQRFLDNVLSTAELAFVFFVQFGHHIISLLCGEYARGGADQVVPEVGFVVESFKNTQ